MTSSPKLWYPSGTLGWLSQFAVEQEQRFLSAVRQLFRHFSGALRASCAVQFNVRVEQRQPSSAPDPVRYTRDARSRDKKDVIVRITIITLGNPGLNIESTVDEFVHSGSLGSEVLCLELRGIVRRTIGVEPVARIERIQPR